MSDTSDSTGSWREFLEKAAPGSSCPIADCVGNRNARGETPVLAPRLKLYCHSCDHTQFFEGKTQPLANGIFEGHRFLYYHCNNCRSSLKTYAVRIELHVETSVWHVMKIGEDPAFGSRVPGHVRKLVGEGTEDWDRLMKARKSEDLGLGIGAFAYYRQIVEQQKNRIFDRVIEVARRVGGHDDLIAEIEDAKSHPQFSRAVESVKKSLPESLFVDAQNPLLSLHSALSIGLHSKNDEECLAISNAIRAVLTDFSRRAREILREDDEVRAALNRLNELARQRPESTEGQGEDGGATDTSTHG